MQNFFDTFINFYAWLSDFSLTRYTFYFLLYAFLAYLCFKISARITLFVVKQFEKNIPIFHTFWQKSLEKIIPHFTSSVIFYLYSTRFELGFIKKIALIYFTIIFTLIISEVLKKIVILYQKLNLPDNFNIKGIIQLLQVLLHILAIFYSISILIDQSAWKILSGLGAITALILLVFRDIILGFVAGIQIFSNDLIRIGDWIEVKNYNADGDVIDISLTTVQVQNWDKTISSIPTHILLNQSFKNWRGMQSSGGRRVKTEFYIDMKTVRFVSNEDIEQFKKIELIENFIEKSDANHLTTAQLFREYCYVYLKSQDRINQNMTLLVRQMGTTSKGLCMQIYFFTKTIVWEDYESIRSEMIEHFISVAKNFNLKLFQDFHTD